MANSKCLVSLIGCLLISFCGYCQINMKDSTVQVVGYWSKGDKQSYTITETKLKVEKGDTVKVREITYDVDITVKDSSSNSYLIEWDYSNIKVDSPDSMIQAMINCSRLNKAVIRTDELGSFQEVVNWEEIGEGIRRMATPVMKKYQGNPQMTKFIEQLLNNLSSKQAIEQTVIKEIQLFYTFHGGQYDINQAIETKSTLPNNLGGKPYDTNLTFWVDEVDTANYNFTLCVKQEVDSIQFNDAIFDYTTKTARTMGIAPPTREETPPSKCTIWRTAVMDESGWPIYSILTKEVEIENKVNIEDTKIVMK